MKICLLVKDFAVGKKFSKNGLPTKSGAEFHAENHAKQLILRGHQVTIMAKKRYSFTKAREWLGDIDLVRLHAPFRWLEVLARLLTTHRDMEAFYLVGTPKFAVWAVLYANWAKKPVTLTLTGKSEIFDGNANWRNRIFRQCTNYIATSHEIRNGLIERGGIPADHVTVLPHGIDVARYPRVAEEERRRLRERHHLRPDTLVLLFCARVVIDKGIDTLQKLWPMLHRKDPSARLFIVGGGRTELLEELREMGKALDDSVTVVGEVDAPQEYYQMSDVYVFPSRHEGLPTSLIEAMSCGLPVVASDIGGCNDLVVDGETGFLVPTEDVNGFYEKILHLFLHEAERLRMGANGSRRAAEMFDYSVVIGNLAEVIASHEAKSHDYMDCGGKP